MAKWRTELRELTRRSPDFDEEVEKMIEAVQKTESDRGCALIAGSTAEICLENIIKAKMRPLNKERSSQLFMGEGALSSFSAKINIAFAFSFIDEELRDEFDRIREIRNSFAHARIAITFKTPQIKNACLGLMKSKEGEKINPRILYVNSVFTLIHASVIAQKNPKRQTPISYNEVLVSAAKFFQEFLQQTQGNHLAENIEPTPPDLSESSPA